MIRTARAQGVASAALPALLTVVLATGCGGGGAARPGDHETLPQALDRTVRNWHERAWVPGVAVSVRRGGSLAWSGAAGYADERANTPMSADMAFYIASATKPFVAATTLSLVEDGVLGLDDPLGKYVDFPHSTGVTLRHLLSMRSGIPDYTQAYGFTRGVEEDLLRRRTRRWSAAELLSIAASAKPEFAPGARFGYSNTNYILLGEVIRAATGRTWNELLEERVVEPLRLERTLLPTDGDEPVVAAGHTDLDGDANRDGLAGRPYASVVTAAGPAGGLVSTAADLTAFARGVFGGSLLSPETLAAMTRVERIGYEREYGLGVFVHQPDLRSRVIGHTGAGIGYSSVVWYAPEHDLAIAVLVNDSIAEPEDLAELLLRQVLRH